MGYLDLGPLKLGEILDRMFVIYRRNFLLLFSISALPYLLLLPIVGFFILVSSIPTPTPQEPPSPAAFVAVFAVMFVTMVVFLFCGLASWLATTAAVWQLQMGGKPTIRGVYRVAWHRFLPGFGAAIIVGMALMIGYMLLIIPAVFVALELCLTMAAIVCEGAGPFQAISRSRVLVSGYRGRIFVAWLVCGAVSTAISYMLILPPVITMAFIAQSGSIPGWLIAAIVTGYFFGLTLPAPLLAIALCLIYYDARVRKEGFDLQRLLDELPPASSGAVPEIAAS